MSRPVFRIGEDIAVGIIVDPSAVASIQSARAWIMRSDNLSRFVPMAGNTAIELVPAPRAASGDVGPGWNFTLHAAQSRDLAPGTYGIDCRIVFSGGAEELSEDTLLIDVTRAAAP